LSSPDRVPDELPVLHVAGWYDIFCQGTISGFHARANDRDRLIVGPWAHDPSMTHLVGDCNIGPASNALVFGLTGHLIDFFDDAAAGVASRLPRVSTFAIGEDDWRADVAWPPPNAVILDVPLCETAFEEDPENPTPALGGRGLLVQVPGWGFGPRDHAAIANRPDVGVLVVRSDLGETGLAGPASLRFAAGAPDGQERLWVGTLCVRRGDGHLHDLLSAAVRTSSTVVEIPLGDTRFTLSAGERLEVLVSTAAWPRWAHEPDRGARLEVTSAELRLTVVPIPALTGAA
jgi:predicted acyl esterase